MKLVMAARMAIQPPLHRNKIWAMTFLQIMLTVQPPMNRAAPPLLTRTLLVDIVSTFLDLKFQFYIYTHTYNQNSRKMFIFFLLLFINLNPIFTFIHFLTAL